MIRMEEAWWWEEHPNANWIRFGLIFLEGGRKEEEESRANGMDHGAASLAKENAAVPPELAAFGTELLLLRRDRRRGDVTRRRGSRGANGRKIRPTNIGKRPSTVSKHG